MANSRRRCRKCGESRRLEELRIFGIQAQCTDPCAPSEPTRAKATGSRKSAPADDDYRPAILSRDGHQCVFCGGRANLRVHHIEYGGVGRRRTHEAWALITLCSDHHDLVHTNKRTFQPLLRGYIWALYFECRRVTIPQLMLELAEDVAA